MIGAAARTGQLSQRLRAKAGRLVAERVKIINRRQRTHRTDWHSAAALWPDLFGDRPDGK